jgi:DNA-binding SARP family transcriptional activator
LITLAWVYWLSGQHEQAVASLNELRSVSLPGSSAEGYYYCASGNLALDEGRVDQAPALYGQARSIGEVSGEPSINILVRLGMSRYHRLNDAPAAARDWANDALTIASRIGYRHFQGLAFIERARAAWILDDIAAAEVDLQAAIDILSGLGAAFDLTRARFLLAALLHQQRRDEAVSAWREVARDIIEGNYAFLLEQERALAFPLLSAYQKSSDANLVWSCAVLLEHLGRVPPPALRIVALGRWEVWQGSQCIPKRALIQRRAGELLALLLLAPSHRLSYDQVVEALFPDKHPVAAQVLFHHATSALRRALESDLPEKFLSRYLEVEEGQVTFHPPPEFWVDFEAFEAHCQSEEWEAALLLYGGELLPDYRYADWTIAPRERLNLLYQRALLSVAKDRLAEGRFAQALEACQLLLEVEPWHEQAVLLGMRACIALNDLANARRLYLKLEKTLRDELATTPQPELQAYYRSLNPINS